MNFNHDIVVTVIVTAALTCLLLSWFYEHELKRQSQTIKALKASHLDRTYDWLQARAEAAVERDLRWSFSDQLLKHQCESNMDEHLATLFDEELMKGNQD